MADYDTLNVFLYDLPIGRLTNLPGDKNFFTFNQEYLENKDRPILSLSFKDNFGDLISEIKTTRTRLPSFFSNLLPEGHMRTYLASHAKVNSEREFYLLSVLGQDLPGAITVMPETQNKFPYKKENQNLSNNKNKIYHFSLAGVQLKFSAIAEKDGGLTIPADGIGGSWIIKLPSFSYKGVPENEYVMMELARQMGMDVPKTALVPLSNIHGLPKDMGSIKTSAFIIERFDRDSNGGRIHIEDFAQIFGVYPEKKYRSASYLNIVKVIWAETGEKGLSEFIRRFVFNALIGNGDMHLKNWSLIYLDKKQASLAPAYDFVSTIPYLPNDDLALKFVDSKAFSSLSLEQFKRFATKAALPEKLLLEIVRDTIESFSILWKSIKSFPLDPKIISIINTHLKTIPLWKHK